MGIFSAIFGQDDSKPTSRRSAAPVAPARQTAATASPAASEDEQALARYRYLLRTAPPEAIEQVHAEAFARLTPEQRAQALQDIAAAVPAHERAALVSGQGDPQALARAATRAELREPGFLERTLGGSGGAMSTGAMIGTTLLGSFVASMAGSMLAQQLMNGFGNFGGFDGQNSGSEGDAGTAEDEPQTESEDVDAAYDSETADTDEGDSPDLDDGDLGGDFGGGDDFA